MTENLIVRGYTIRSEDGVLVRVEETPERTEVVLSLSRGADLETARLTKAQWDAMCDLRYKLEIREHQEQEVDVVDRQEPDAMDRAKADMEARGTRG